LASALTATECARRIVAANERGQELVAVLATAGEAAGARLLVSRDGVVAGTLGSSSLDDVATALAARVYTTGEPIFAEGLFAELHGPAEQLLIFGAGHIAVPLAELGTTLGFAVTVLDDRDEFASVTRFPAAARVTVLDFNAPLKGLAIGPLTYVVLVTRAHKHDFDLLNALLDGDRQPRYIGMIGSRRRVRAAFTALLEGGMPKEKLEPVHAPVGLDIGAETPAEIAVSIAAELVRVRRGGSAASLSNEERVLERFFPELAK
jgi:xanthine dehydrogenase accessory factor